MWSRNFNESPKHLPPRSPLNCTPPNGGHFGRVIACLCRPGRIRNDTEASTEGVFRFKSSAVSGRRRTIVHFKSARIRRFGSRHGSGVILELQLVLSAAVLVIVIDRSILRRVRPSDSIKSYRRQKPFDIFETRPKPQATPQRGSPKMSDSSPHGIKTWRSRS